MNSLIGFMLSQILPALGGLRAEDMGRLTLDQMVWNGLSTFCQSKNRTLFLTIGCQLHKWLTLCGSASKAVTCHHNTVMWVYFQCCAYFLAYSLVDCKCLSHFHTGLLKCCFTWLNCQQDFFSRWWKVLQIEDSIFTPMDYKLHKQKTLNNVLIYYRKQ